MAFYINEEELVGSYEPTISEKKPRVQNDIFDHNRTMVSRAYEKPQKKEKKKHKVGWIPDTPSIICVVFFVILFIFSLIQSFEISKLREILVLLLLTNKK
jgi:hypothetical protein